MNLFKYFRNIRDRIRKKSKFIVRVKVWNEHAQQYAGHLDFTTDATSKAAAKNTIKENVRLHVTDCWLMKEHVNGSKP